MTMVEDADVAAEAPGSAGERRSYLFEYEQRAAGDGLTLEGYAAVFDQPATIVDWRGRYTETIQRGAFKKTLSERQPTTMLFEHGMHPLIGGMPIAEINRLREDSRGLHFQARMHDNWLVEPVRDAIRSGGIQHMSLEMYVLRDEWSTAKDKRSVLEVNRVPEISPVLNPAYTGTSLSLRSLRSLDLIVAEDDEIRSALRAAHEGTPASAPEPHPEHSVPDSTLALWARVMSRRFAG